METPYDTSDGSDTPSLPMTDPTLYAASADGTDPYAEEPYVEDMESLQPYWPYYEAEPVQFAYTPADIPERPPVVRPDRDSPAALTVPIQARAPLYNLVTVAQPSTDKANSTLAVGRPSHELFR